MTRPTHEQIKEARHIVDIHRRSKYHGTDVDDALHTLLAATEPMEHEAVYGGAKSAWQNAAAENEDDFTEGYFAAVRHILGTSEGK